MSVASASSDTATGRLSAPFSFDGHQSPTGVCYQLLCVLAWSVVGAQETRCLPS